MRAAALLFALTLPAAALTDSQLKAQVQKERRQYDSSMNSFNTKKQAWSDSQEKLDGLKKGYENGQKKGSVGGQACKIMNCINKQQKVVEKKEALAAAALEKARQQAQEYLDKEAAYKAQTGHNLDPATIADAGDFLTESSKVNDSLPTALGDGPTLPKTGCVDSRGIPCMPEGTDNPDVAIDPGIVNKPGATDTGTEQNVGGGAGDRIPGQGLGDLGTGGEAAELAGFASARTKPFLDGSYSVQGGAKHPSFMPARLEGRPLGEDNALASARLELQRGALSEAASAVRAALRANPRSFEAHLLDAQVKNAQGDWEGGEAAARRAIAMNPNDSSAYKALAVALLHQGKDAEALEASESAARLDPDDAESQMLRAFAFEGMGRKAEMMAAVEKAASLDARFLPYLKLARAGRILFDRRRTAKGWRGFPIPDLEEPAAPGDGAAPGANKAVLAGLALLAGAAALFGFALWKKRSGPRRVTI
ncbi:MAG: tetratricopeptide repeat protein [Elusimicrobia bacterium]|nr:tetratricopeptide repeat protein [Elusimicrobiota bacterium]